MRGGYDGAGGHPLSPPVPPSSCEPINIYVNIVARQLEEVCWKGRCNSSSKMWRGPIRGTIHGLGVICCKYLGYCIITIYLLFSQVLSLMVESLTQFFEENGLPNSTSHAVLDEQMYSKSHMLICNCHVMD